MPSLTWLSAMFFSETPRPRVVDEELRIQLFNQISGQYGQAIKRVCYGFARCRADLDDLTQDVMVNLWQGLPRYRGESSLKTWVYRVALNTCVSASRRHKAESAGFEPAEGMVAEVDCDYERRQLVVEMHQIIALLPPVDKAIVMLWLDEFSYDEIARMIGLPRNTVATRLRRAKQKLANL